MEPQLKKKRCLFDLFFHFTWYFFVFFSCCSDHQKTKEALAELDGKAMSPMVRQKIDKMMEELLEHIRMEEEPGGDLDQLRQHLSEHDLLHAGTSFERTKMFAPTHPHPSAPDKPPFETVVALLTAPVDKLRDLFRQFPEESEVKRATVGWIVNGTDFMRIRRKNILILNAFCSIK